MATLKRPIIFFLLVIVSILSFGQDFNSVKLYDKGVEYFKNNNFKAADSLYTASLELYPNVDAFYNLAITKLKLADTCNFCHNLKKASMLGDDVSTTYYNKFCTEYADKMMNYYRASDSVYSAIIKTNPNPNAFLDLALTKAKLGDKCAFCENLENPSLSKFTSIQSVIDKKCYTTKNILIKDSSKTGNRIYNSILTETCTNKKKYVFLEIGAANDTIFKFITSEIQAGRIINITIDEWDIPKDSDTFILNIDTTELEMNDKSLFVQKKIKQKKQDPILTVVEEMPSFLGGEEDMYRWLANNIKYPQIAKETGIAGVVVITYIVEKDGSLTDIKVIRNVGGGCSEEAVRVVKAMPKWKPGKQKGVPVRVEFILPIRFTLE